MEKWMIYSKKADFKAIGEKFEIDPVLARVIRNRDVIGEEEIRLYLNGTKEDMYSPFLMKDMEKGVNILIEKIEKKKAIRIIGDYDVDGVNSLYILWMAFRKCGAVVDGEIPHRIMDGYGINERLIEQAHQDGIDTIVTCDNGISAREQVRFAKSLGMTVIITDHHDIPYEEIEGNRNYILPEADAVINPKQSDCEYPFKGLCGAGVVYKLVMALYEQLGYPKEEAEEFLEFAAIATVGDVMDLLGENRILVKEGLKRLHKTKNLGLKSLITVNEIEAESINAYHIGFILGPCLNAGGRLDTAKRALELLMAEDKKTADEAAGELKALNDSRKMMTKEGVEQAVSLIESTDLKQDKVLVVYLPECHESLAGIIAGRIREKYYKPVFVLTKAEEGIKGSGRSIETYSMYEELIKSKEYLEKFGGHPMAAGLSLKEENLELFRRSVNEKTTLTEADLIPVRWIDVAMPMYYVTEKFIDSLTILEPFGKGNEKPVFAEKNLKILMQNIVGKNRNAVKLLLEEENGNQIDAIYFGNGEEFIENTVTKEKISVLYYPSINEYRGNKKIQMVITHYL